MFSAKLIYSTGITVGIFSIILWTIILKAQLRDYKNNKSVFKKVLMAFAISSILSNIVPIWFYFYRLTYNSNPTNIFYAYVVNVYIYQIVTAVMFYILYKY